MPVIQMMIMTSYLIIKIIARPLQIRISGIQTVMAWVMSAMPAQMIRRMMQMVMECAEG